MYLVIVYKSHTSQFNIFKLIHLLISKTKTTNVINGKYFYCVNFLIYIL